MFRKRLIESLEILKSNNRYRKFLEIDRSDIVFADVSSKRVVVWCSNDYLGMSGNSHVVNALISSAKLKGIGSGGTRNISGNSSEIVQLEKDISEFHQKESGIVFTSGYVANQSALAGIVKAAGKDCIIFSDEKNHASIIYGIKESGAKKIIYKHNDIDDLEKNLKLYPVDTPKIIVFEAIYSMSGLVPKIHDIVLLAKKYNAITYVDEVHSVGLYGENGSGICEELGVQKEIDIIQGSFAKAFGTIGGYVVSDSLIIDSIRSYSPGFIFTTSLPIPLISATIESIKQVKKSKNLRLKLKENVKTLKLKLKKEKINIVKNSNHIIGIKIGNAAKCKKIQEKLFENYNIYIQAINFPTVPVGEEMLRITANPSHTEAMIDELVYALKNTLN